MNLPFPWRPVVRPALIVLIPVAALYLALPGCTSPGATGSGISRGRGDFPGIRADGSVLLPSQWSLRPVGKQIPMGDFPSELTLHPGGKFGAVLHSGQSQQEIILIDVAKGNLISRVAVEETFRGLKFNRDGTRLFCSGAGTETVLEFPFADGFVGKPRVLRLRPVAKSGIPSGLAVSAAGDQVWVGNLLGHSVTLLDAASGSVIGELPLDPVPDAGGGPASVPATPKPQTEDEAAITKRAEVALAAAQGDHAYPYECVLDESRHRLYVSLWGLRSVAVLDTRSRQVLERWVTEEHPNEMILNRKGSLLFVANANRNTVSVIDTSTGRTLETLAAQMTPEPIPGSTPNSVALSPDEHLLFVANANLNAVSVFDVSQPGRSRSLGFIPVGWYPTSVRVSLDGRQLVVANGKGTASRANRLGPQPGIDGPGSAREYIGSLMKGTVSVIQLPAGDGFEGQMKLWTAQALKGLPTPLPPAAADHPIPHTLGQASPIQHVIYIIKENRTYDQVLGDLPTGNGDPSICLFPEAVTPNHHALAREFVLLDNFYVESEVSADGHEWTVGAYASDFVEKVWPLSYGHNGHKKYTYPAEGNFPIATPAGGYLWDRAREAGVSYRSYGEFVNNGKTPEEPKRSRVSSLKDHFDPWYQSFDMDYQDQKRADRFISELHRFEREGAMPRLSVVRLPNDHTAGTGVGKYTPTACVADNDLAFGRVVEAVSHSKFWPSTAIFVVEDDAQNGPDHVDAHRTIAYVISPYIKRCSVDSTLYSTASMLRTMELILGLKPMSQFDALARPMLASFQARPDLAPYNVRPAKVDIHARNGRTAWGARESSTMNFAREDAADDLKLNRILWHSIKGASVPMPPPRRAGFVLSARQGDGDDD